MNNLLIAFCLLTEIEINMLDEQVIKFLALQRIHQLFPSKAQSLASSVSSHQQSPVGNHIEGKSSPRIVGLCWAVAFWHSLACSLKEISLLFWYLSDAAFHVSFLSSPPLWIPTGQKLLQVPLFNYLQIMAMKTPSVTSDFLLEIFSEFVCYSSWN